MVICPASARSFLRLTALAAASLLFAAWIQGSTKKTDPTCPDDRPASGPYVNYSYGFAILIPRGKEGIWNSARCVSDPKYGCVCMSDHGRMIPLNGEADSERYIEAYAGFAADLDVYTLDAEVEKRLGWLRDDSEEGSLSVVQRTNINLGGLRAIRVVVRYRDKNSHRDIVEDFVEALRIPHHGPVVEYSVYVHSLAGTYLRDRAIFDVILESFKLRPCDNC